MTQAEEISTIEELEPLPEYRSILLAADSSDHANRGIVDAAEIAGLWNARVTGTHVYAAKMHDMRFRQMEGGLPEQFRQEQELERQRVVHDDLITRGLSIITDSYLDQVERVCTDKKLDFRRSSLEGKNYTELTREANNDDYDLLILGAKGLGAIRGSVIGTVCERVSRRSQIDTLVIKDPNQTLKQGPIVIAVDGSTYAYGGLLRGIALAQQWNVPLHVISAFDPYYHYVAFNRIAGVLSEEAGKVFRFQEQEQLHEEIIDSGLAKIYDGHLAVAQGIADDYEIEIETSLLDGKPWDVILKYVKNIKASLLIVGKTGIHADDELDIGGNTENLLRLSDCAILMSHHAHQPQVERLADITTTWTAEAEQRMTRVPSFVQNMARAAILRYAQARGHTVITESIVEEATRQLMPGRAEQAIEEIVNAYDAGELKRSVTTQPMEWSITATVQLEKIEDQSLRSNLAMRAEKKARSHNTHRVEFAHIEAFLDDTSNHQTDKPHWHTAALSRLSRVPEGFMRETTRQRIEEYAKNNRIVEISLEVAESGLAASRAAMEKTIKQQKKPAEGRSSAMEENEKGSICPFARAAESKISLQQKNIHWKQEALKIIQNVPPGYCQDMTRKAAETIAGINNISEIDGLFLQSVMETFKQGAAEVEETMPWDQVARERIAKAPDMVRGMLIGEIETWVNEQGGQQVTQAAVDAVKQRWQDRGVFHLSPNDPRNQI